MQTTAQLGGDTISSLSPRRDSQQGVSIEVLTSSGIGCENAVARYKGDKNVIWENIPRIPLMHGTFQISGYKGNELKLLLGVNAHSDPFSCEIQTESIIKDTFETSELERIVTVAKRELTSAFDSFDTQYVVIPFKLHPKTSYSTKIRLLLRADHNESKILINSIKILDDNVSSEVSTSNIPVSVSSMSSVSAISEKAAELIDTKKTVKSENEDYSNKLNSGLYLISPKDNREPVNRVYENMYSTKFSAKKEDNDHNNEINITDYPNNNNIQHSSNTDNTELTNEHSSPLSKSYMSYSNNNVYNDIYRRPDYFFSNNKQVVNSNIIQPKSGMSALMRQTSTQRKTYFVRDLERQGTNYDQFDSRPMTTYDLNDNRTNPKEPLPDLNPPRTCSPLRSKINNSQRDFRRSGNNSMTLSSYLSNNKRNIPLSASEMKRENTNNNSNNKEEEFGERKRRSGILVVSDVCNIDYKKINRSLSANDSNRNNPEKNVSSSSVMFRNAENKDISVAIISGKNETSTDSLNENNFTKSKSYSNSPKTMSVILSQISPIINSRSRNISGRDNSQNTHNIDSIDEYNKLITTYQRQLFSSKNQVATEIQDKLLLESPDSFIQGENGDIVNIYDIKKNQKILRFYMNPNSVCISNKINDKKDFISVKNKSIENSFRRDDSNMEKLSNKSFADREGKNNLITQLNSSSLEGTYAEKSGNKSQNFGNKSKTEIEKKEKEEEDSDYESTPRPSVKHSFTNEQLMTKSTNIENSHRTTTISNISNIKDISQSNSFNNAIEHSVENSGFYNQKSTRTNSVAFNNYDKSLPENNSVINNVPNISNQEDNDQNTSSQVRSIRQSIDSISRNSRKESLMAQISAERNTNNSNLLNSSNRSSRAQQSINVSLKYGDNQQPPVNENNSMSASKTYRSLSPPSSSISSSPQSQSRDAEKSPKKPIYLNSPLNKEKAIVNISADNLDDYYIGDNNTGVDNEYGKLHYNRSSMDQMSLFESFDEMTSRIPLVDKFNQRLKSLSRTSSTDRTDSILENPLPGMMESTTKVSQHGNEETLQQLTQSAQSVMSSQMSSGLRTIKEDELAQENVLKSIARSRLLSDFVSGHSNTSFNVVVVKEVNGMFVTLKSCPTVLNMDNGFVGFIKKFMKMTPKQRRAEFSKMDRYGFDPNNTSLSIKLKGGHKELKSLKKSISMKSSNNNNNTLEFNSNNLIAVEYGIMRDAGQMRFNSRLLKLIYYNNMVARSPGYASGVEKQDIYILTSDNTMARSLGSILSLMIQDREKRPGYTRQKYASILWNYMKMLCNSRRI